MVISVSILSCVITPKLTPTTTSFATGTGGHGHTFPGATMPLVW